MEESDEINNTEVKPTKDGWYYVKLYQYNKEDCDDPDYFHDWVEFRNENWDYAGYEGYAFACEILKKED